MTTFRDAGMYVDHKVLGAEVGFEPHDLWRMKPTRYRAALLRTPSGSCSGHRQLGPGTPRLVVSLALHCLTWFRLRVVLQHDERSRAASIRPEQGTVRTHEGAQADVPVLDEAGSFA